MIYLIDNYDSFSYNLYQLVADVAGKDQVTVVRNDALTVDELADARPSALVISPGPGRPADAGICEDAVRALTGRVPILGVCLGHQAICEALGGTVTYAKHVLHGKSSLVLANADATLFRGIKVPMLVGRYHSLAVDEATLPACLRAVATSEDGDVMAVQHVEHPTFGVQFHPESILTPAGRQLVQNFVDLIE